VARIYSELAQVGVEVFVTVTTSHTKEATKAAPAVPVVAMLASPVEGGIVQSLGRPGGHVTGMTTDVGPEFHGKQVELIKDVLPKAKNVAFLIETEFAGHVMVKAIRNAARARGLDLFDALWAENRFDNRFDAAFKQIEAKRPDALLVPAMAPHSARRVQIVEFARKMRLPDFHYYVAAAEVGGLCAYGLDTSDLWRKMARYVDRILKGAKPADLPMQQPTRFEMVINLKTAKQLGITFPPAVLARADRVIE